MSRPVRGRSYDRAHVTKAPYHCIAPEPVAPVRIDSGHPSFRRLSLDIGSLVVTLRLQDQVNNGVAFVKKSRTLTAKVQRDDHHWRNLVENAPRGHHAHDHGLARAGCHFARVAAGP